jgi:hypothetical protein
MTTETKDKGVGITKAAADIAAERKCLRCSKPFWSDGFGERICTRCKGSSVWRSASAHRSDQGRRRSGGQPR